MGRDAKWYFVGISGATLENCRAGGAQPTARQRLGGACHRLTLRHFPFATPSWLFRSLALPNHPRFLKAEIPAATRKGKTNNYVVEQVELQDPRCFY